MSKTKYFAKIISLIMALIMLSSVIILPASAASAPAAPAKITSAQSSSAIRLTWSKVSGATGYRIYYKLPGDISWRQCVKATTATTHTFTGLPGGQSYRFAVRSYSIKNSKVIWGGYIETEAMTKTAAPEKIVAAQNTSTIKLSWSKVRNADGYRIFYKTHSSAPWQIMLSSTTAITYTISGLPSDQRILFAVRSYILTSKGVVWGDYKTIETATCPATPYVNATATSSSITLKWNGIRPDGYRIYYRSASGGNWKIAVNTTSATSHTFSGLATGKSYVFAVRAYIKTASGVIWSGYKEVSAKTAPVITVGTGITTGTYYAFTNAAGPIIKPEGYNFNVISSGGSKHNIEMIDDGTAQFAIVQNDVMNYAYKGVNTFYSPIRSFSAVASIYPEICQIVASKESGIISVADLKGKKVAIGAVGSGVYFSAHQILKAAGLDVENDITPIFAPFSDIVDALKDGKIDAAFIVASTPTVAVHDLCATKDVLVVDIDRTVIDKLIAEYPFYQKYEIPKETYRQYINKSTNTVAISSTFIASNDLPTDVVYEITKNLWEKQPEIARAHAKGNELKLENAISYMGNVPLHPGAAKYYKEIGLIK